MRLNDDALILSVSGCRARPEEAAACPWEHEVLRLFDELRNPVLRYLLTFHITPQDGEEIVQEVFLRLVKHLQQGGGRESLRGWIFRVAHNIALKGYRSRRHETADSGAICVDPSPNPEERAARLQRRDLLIAALERLPEQDRLCIALRGEGLRYREIAETLGIGIATVSDSLARSINALRRECR